MGKLDLVEILKNCPKGTKLYCTVFGDVLLDTVSTNDIDYPIFADTKHNGIAEFTKEGRYFSDEDGECVLFPSKECRDWAQFKQLKQGFQKGDYVSWCDNDGNEFFGVFDKYTVSGQYLVRSLQNVNGAYYGGNPKDLTRIEKFDPKWLKAGNIVLVRNHDNCEWCYTLFSHTTSKCKRMPYVASSVCWAQCIPYNDETKHLVGTTDAAPEFYQQTNNL